MKVKIAVFGINDAILQVIKSKLDPRKVEITVFVDNDKAKNNIFYMNIPVIRPESLLENYVVDYVLVTALSSYKEISNQLIKLGVREECIQPFIPEQLCQYKVGPLDRIDTDFIDLAYFEPEKAIAKIAEYRKIYQEYSGISILYENGEGEWFDKSRLISHACGGVVNGKKIVYSNSKEALQYSIEKNFKLIECDVLKLKGEWFLASDLEYLWEGIGQGQYTVMSLTEFLEYVKDYPDITILVDVKWRDHSEYKECVDRIKTLIRVISENEMAAGALKKRIVMEVYDEETIKIAKEENFDMIFTQYRNPDWACGMNTANICYRYGIRAIAMDLSKSFILGRRFQMIVEKNIKVFVFSTDSMEDYRTLMGMGVSGIFTNYLTEDLLER